MYLSFKSDGRKEATNKSYLYCVLHFISGIPFTGALSLFMGISSFQPEGAPVVPLVGHICKQ